MNRKIIPVILIVAVACVALAACMNNGGTGAQPTPSATANYAPNNTDGNAYGTPGGGAAGMNNNNTGAAGNTAANNACSAYGAAVVCFTDAESDACTK